MNLFRHKARPSFYEWLSWQKWLPKKFVYFMAIKVLAIVTTTTLSNREPGSVGFLEAMAEYADQNNIYGHKEIVNES